MEGKPSLRTEYSMVIIMALMWGFVGINRIGISFLFPVLLPLFHMTYFQAGLLLSGTSVFWAVSSWISGSIGDRYRKKLVFVPAMIFAGVMAALMGAAGGFASMLVIRGLLGIGDGVGASVGYGMVADGSSPFRRGLNMGLYGATYTLIGAGLGAIVITRLSAALGWRWVFPLIGLITIIIAMAVFWVVKDVPKKQTETRERYSPWEVFKYPSMKWVIIINCLALTWMQVSTGFNALYLTRVHHVSPLVAGSILSGWGIAGFVGQLIFPGISDFIGRKRVIVICAIISTATYLIFITGTFTTGMVAVLLAATGFFGYGQQSLTVAIIIAEAVPQRLRATALGTANFFAVIVGATIMPAVAGWSAGKWGLSSPLIMAATAMLLIVLFTLLVPETAPRRARAGNAVQAAEIG